MHSYKMLADAVESRHAYSRDCQALLLCGEKDHAGDIKVFNRKKWAAGEKIPLVWIPGAGITRMLIILALCEDSRLSNS